MRLLKINPSFMFLFVALFVPGPLSCPAQVWNAYSGSSVSINNPTAGQSLRFSNSGTWKNQKDTINVTDFGANGNDSADDSTAIQAAFTAAAQSAGTLIGVDGNSLEPTTFGGTVFFPPGEYRISQTINARGIRVVGSLGTEIQAEIPSQYTQYTDGAIFKVYPSNSSFEHLFLDFFVRTSVGDLDEDPYGLPNIKPELAWFVAVDDNTQTEAYKGMLYLSHLQTETYSRAAKTFAENRSLGASIKADTCTFQTWKWGFHFTGSFGANYITNCEGLGFRPSDPYSSYSDPDSAFVFSDPGDNSPAGGTGVYMSGCNGLLYYHGVYAKGAYPTWHNFNISNSTFEAVRVGVEFANQAVPSINLTNVRINADQFGILAWNSAQPSIVDSDRFVLANNCSFSFADSPNTPDIHNNRLIWFYNTNVPISFSNCIFEGIRDPDPSLSGPILFFQTGKQVTFVGNTVWDKWNSSRNYADAISFIDIGDAVIFNSNNVGIKGSGTGISVQFTGFPINTSFTAVGNRTSGTIAVSPTNPTPIARKNVTANTVY